MKFFKRRFANIMKPSVLRIFDIILSTFGLLCASPVMLLILLLGAVNTGQPIFFQKRLGRNKVLFALVKFRTMTPNTPSVATHLASSHAVTPLGRFLRQTKLD